MKKQLLALVLSVFALSSVTAQNYYYQRTFGVTAAEYNPLLSTGTTDLILAEATPKTKVFSANQTMPFTWNFYGQPVTTYKVSSSGYLTFNTSMAADSNQNVAIPSVGAPRASIFAFWDNLKVLFATGVNASFPQGVRSWTYGTAPNRVHVVQWQLLQKDDSSPNLTNVTQFAIRFYEANGGTKFDIVHNLGSGTFNATVGVQSIDGVTGTQVFGSPDMNWGGTEQAYSAAGNVVYTFNYGTQTAYDLKMTRVELPKFSEKNQAINVGYSFTNNGGQTVSSFRVNYNVDGGIVVSQNVTGQSVTGSGMGTFSFAHDIPFTPSTSGTRRIKVWIDNINGSNADMNRADDTASASVAIVDGTVKRKSLHEIFTSSTCPPCLPGNIQLQDVLRQRMGGYTVIKYQYFGPGAGDPYFTPECYTRGVYYDQTPAGTAGYSVPYLVVDGGWRDNANSYTTQIFDGFYAKPSVVSIQASQTITDNTISITAKIKPTGALAGNYKVHFAVLEKTTTRNRKNNGETEFHWVLKKMLPNASGTTITFSSDAEQTLTQSHTFPGGYRLPTAARTTTTIVPTGGGYSGINLATENTVEEMSDLIGVVFVQDESDEEVLQSEWSGNQPWDYWAGVEETKVGETQVSFYPNPASTSLTINALEVKGAAEVKIFDLTGKLVLSEKVEGGIESAIDVSALNNGLYLVQITANGTTSTSKLTIGK